MESDYLEGGVDPEVISLRKRKGHIIFTQEFLRDTKPEILSEIFSKVFPAAIEVIHDLQFYGKLRYYCYSMLFRELVEGEVNPEYMVWLKDENGKVILDKIEERKSV